MAIPVKQELQADFFNLYLDSLNWGEYRQEGDFHHLQDPAAQITLKQYDFEDAYEYEEQRVLSRVNWKSDLVTALTAGEAGFYVSILLAPMMVVGVCYKMIRGR